MIIKDADLRTVEEMEERVMSINKQLDRLDAVRNPRNFCTHHTKYSKLVARKDSLVFRIHTIRKDKTK